MYKIIVGTVIGLGLGFGLGILFMSNYQGHMSGVGDESADEPLYWVAPMDANYRRDEPGQSPMGMDLVPVFEEGGDVASGVVEISPVVVNNLGVRTARVREATLRSAITTVGYVGLDEEQVVHMHPRVEGWVEELYVKTEGERVERGDAIYALYSPTLVSAQEELLLALERDSQTLQAAAQARLRALQLSASQIERIRTQRSVMQTVTYFAPQSGVVTHLGVREGHFVQPGNPLISIGVLDEVWVTAEVFERQAGWVNAGDRVTMTLDYLPGREWQGEVDYVYPILDQQTRTARLRLRFDNPDQALRPNMFAQVRIHAEQSAPVVLVPSEAIIRTGHQDRVVLARGEGRFKSVEVTLGRRGDNGTEILAGLEAGDEVVTSAQFLLDSESSIESDFQRMEDPEDMEGMEMQGTAESTEEGMAVETSEPPDSDAPVWTRARVEALMGENRLSLQHDPVPEWNWPAMTMMFNVAADVDISELEVGDTLEVEMTRVEGGQIISAIRDTEQNNSGGR